MIKEGSFVIYRREYHDGTKSKKQYGVVKRLNTDQTKAYVWYHSGCTAASTPIEYLEETYEQHGHSECHRGCKHCMSITNNQQEGVIG